MIMFSLGYSNLTTSVTRLNKHSPLPTGTFTMEINDINITSIPFDASAETLKSTINAVSFSTFYFVCLLVFGCFTYTS